MQQRWNDCTGPFHTASATDYLPVDRLHELQLSRLRASVARSFDLVPLYRKRMQDHGVTPQDLRCLEDLSRLPFTVKADLRDSYPFGLFASPMQDVVRLHASSGTTGKPNVVAYTRQDLEVWAEAVMRCLAACGVDRGDIIQVSYGYGLFTGGLGLHYGAEALGATVIPTSGGNTERQVMMMSDFGATVVCCTPSYFVHLLDRAKEMGADLHALRTGIFGAEPWSDAMRNRIQESAGIRAFDIYGLSEIVGPGVGIECPCQNGLHILEDHFYPEIIDPNSGQLLNDGQDGELVLTTLSKEAMPMIRYRTRDLTRILPGPCPCGRTLRRIQRISQRSDNMFIVRGVNVFPSQIEAALLAARGTLPYYQIVLTRQKGLDQLEVRVEVTPEVFSDKVGAMEALQRQLATSIEHTIGIHANVRLVELRTLQRNDGKANRVLDQRTDV
jgi:phenylacetate-CoA ligase